MKSGQTGEWTIRHRLPFGRVNVAGFDSEKYAVANGVHGTGRVIGSVIKETSVTLRQRLFDRVVRLTDGLASQRFLLALSFGYRAGLTQDDWQHLASSGLSHLMAISGLHIGMLFVIGWRIGGVILRFVPDTRYHPVYPLIIGLVAATFYAWLSGWSLSAQRALLMCVVASVWLINVKRYRPIDLWLFTLAIVLVIQPFSTLGYALWLSFGAVIALIALHTWCRTLGKWQQIIVMQLGLSLMLSPLQQTLFGGISLLSPILNLFAIPYFAFSVVPTLMMTLLITLISSTVSDNALVRWIAEGLWWCADMALWPINAMLPLFEGQLVSLSPSWRWAAVVAVIAAILCWLLPRRYWRMHFVVAGVLILTLQSRGLSYRDWQLSMLDVGHGLAIVITQGEEAVLYDTGKSWQGGSMANSVVTPVLEQWQITELVGLLISHGDNDHDGGANDITAYWQPSWQRSSDYREGYQPCSRGQSWSWGRLRFEVLWPPRQVKRARNPHSCVVQISDGRHRVVLTGDIDAISELLLAQDAPINTHWVTVVSVPHHGSKTSSTQRFIDLLSPDIALASVSRTNPWGLPSEAVKQRYVQSGAQWLTTVEHGQITITFSELGYQWSGERSSRQNYWYRKLFVELEGSK
nr:DNA internalization-related competence protein ComEC/Rec2 [Thaumasiovibrio subtropicus]